MKAWHLVAVSAAAVVAAASAAAQPVGPPTPAPTPAFPGQTGAPAPKAPSAEVAVQTVARGLSSPWAMAFLPDGRILVTERRGEMRIVRPKDGVYSAPIAGVPGVKVTAGESLHDVVLDPDFARNRLIYFTYFAPPPGEDPMVWPKEEFYDNEVAKPLAERRAHSIGMETLARGRLSEDGKRLEQVKVLLEGSDRRMLFAPDGKLLVLGTDRFRFYDSKMDGTDKLNASLQERRNYAGRVSRINSDGSIPRDNPFVGTAGVDGDVWAFGVRDPDGIAIDPRNGKIWEVEHGPKGGDELNLIKKGADYGWPVVSYGTQYSGKPVNGGLTQQAGTEQPVYYWFPDIGPSSALFYTGEVFPAWKNSLFVGALAGRHLVRLVIENDRVVAEEPLLADLKARIRDVRQGPDGAIWLLTDEGDILRLAPKPGAGS